MCDISVKFSNFILPCRMKSGCNIRKLALTKFAVCGMGIVLVAALILANTWTKK